MEDEFSSMRMKIYMLVQIIRSLELLAFKKGNCDSVVMISLFHIIRYILMSESP
jgi:hypothetical protein